MSDNDHGHAAGSRMTFSTIKRSSGSRAEAVFVKEASFRLHRQRSSKWRRAVADRRKARRAVVRPFRQSNFR
ncbi:hypothetical protein KCP73_03155 [Salmonella enterica subsp. enterica]|nr:hypothetical protein KCP73_03155 [Salmonella enterica subsp. enterica]